MNQEYYLNFKEQFPLPLVSYLFEKTDYGNNDYVCLYDGEQKAFSVYLTKAGMEQAYLMGKRYLLDNDQWQEIFNELKQKFVVIDKINQTQIPKFDSKYFNEWWQMLLAYIKDICDVYVLCEESSLLSLEEQKDNTGIYKRLEFIGQFRLKAHHYLSVLHLLFEKVIIKAGKEFQIALDDIEIMTFDEFSNLIFNKKFVNAPALLQRKSGYVFRKNWVIHTDHEYLGLRDKLSVNKTEKKVTGRVSYQVNEKVVGRAKLHLSFSHVPDLPQDCILITGMTNPQLVPVLKYVKAIVTDEGGLMCHAAIISRELGIPCVVGTRCATQIFNDGDLVEVDTSSGSVRKLD